MATHFLLQTFGRLCSDIARYMVPRLWAAMITRLPRWYIWRHLIEVLLRHPSKLKHCILHVFLLNKVFWLFRRIDDAECCSVLTLHFATRSTFIHPLVDLLSIFLCSEISFHIDGSFISFVLPLVKRYSLLLFVGEIGYNELLDTMVDEDFLLGDPLFNEFNDFGRLTLTRHAIHV